MYKEGLSLRGAVFYEISVVFGIVFRIFAHTI